MYDTICFTVWYMSFGYQNVLPFGATYQDNFDTPSQYKKTLNIIS